MKLKFKPLNFRKFNVVLNVISCSLLALLIVTQPVQAITTSKVSPLTMNDFIFYNQNGIYYYNPYGNLNGDSNCITDSNTGYDGGQVVVGATLDAVKANQPFYEASAQKYGFDWRIIAAIHIKEYGAKRSNPSNGQGAYQLYSYTRKVVNGKQTSELDPAKAFLPAGPISDAEFQRQTDLAASIIASKADRGFSSAEGIKRVFFNYNGANKHYVDKALAMGFSQSEAESGEGSIYVMNRYDARRDPTSGSMDPHWPGMFASDGAWSPTATTTAYGAYPIYISLGGTDTGGSNDVCSYPVPGGGRLPAGASGMSWEQAQAFMEQYKRAVKNKTIFELQRDYGMSANNCNGGIAYNCVSFTKYFINVYTNYASNHITQTGDGLYVVPNLLVNYPDGFTNGGHTPRAYAIFSKTSHSSYGHTGVILGLDTTRGEAYIGEASCGLSPGAGGEKEVRASKYNIQELFSWSFAYPNHLNLQQ